MTEASNKAERLIQDRVTYIHYPVQLRKDKLTTIRAFNNLGSKVNTITLAYAKQLGLQVGKTDIRAQKLTAYHSELLGWSSPASR